MKKLLLTILALTLAISMAIPALAADQLLIYDFADADKDGLIGWNEGLSAAPYNIPKPDFIVKDGQLAITPKAGNFRAGSFYLDKAKGCDWLSELSTGLESGEYSYIRLYIKNNMACDAEDGQFAFSFSLQNMNNTGEYSVNWVAADFTKAVFLNMDGSKAELEIIPTDDSQSNGYKNGYIRIPKGFEGYIFMSAKLEDFPTHTNWGTNPLADFSQLGRLEIDIRRAGNCDGSTNNLILDDLALVKSAQVPATDNPDDGKTDDSGDEGDLSIALYAAAAISGLGALAIRKRK